MEQRGAKIAAYDPKKDSVEGYARLIEKFCGFEPQSVLIVRGTDLYIRAGSLRNHSHVEIMALLAAFNDARLADYGIGVFIEGQMESPRSK